jgi:CrcB protein
MRSRLSYVNLSALALVAIGGAIGSVSRYALSSAILRVTGSLFPLGTFIVNLAGCIAFGAIVGAAEHRFVLTSSARAFLLVGVLGGFTTFSSYVFESAALMQDGQFAAAALNLTGQVAAGLIGFWVAYVVAH